MEPEQTTETVNDPVTETVTDPAPPTTPTVTVETLQAELDKVTRALKDANSEAAKRRKALEAFEQAEAKRKEAEMTEAEKLTAKLEAAEAERKRLEGELKERNINDQKRKVAEKVGLPSALADRLHGETPEEMEADAKAILEALPKPAAPEPPKKQAPKIDPTNPGSNATPNETDAMKRARLFGTPDDIFNLSTVIAKGGGAFIIDKE
jgi:hypothetical protein